jgi:choline-sulfatase
MNTMTRRDSIKLAAAGAMTLAGVNRWAVGQDRPQPNVLFIGVDDLNDWIGCMGGHPQVQTPNLDALAASGAVFTNAHCPSPICNPARASLLTGVHPARSGLHFLAPLFRDTPTLADAVTLPQHFMQSGYHVMGVGKVFHQRHDQASFHETGGKFGEYGPLPPQKLSYPKGHPLWDWGVYPGDEKDTPDHKIADWAIEHLQRDDDKPFFLAAGFYRPHVPMYAPQRYFDLYPPGEVAMPPVHADELAGVSDYALQLTHASTAPRHREIVESGQWEHAVRAYLASVTFMDAQVGRLLDALRRSRHANNTIVVFWSDHGFHLGEKQRWEKRSLWERSTHVPLIITGPGIEPSRCTRPVGTLDLYPTLLDLCDLPPRDGLDGLSLRPLLADPDADWRPAVVTSFGPCNHAVRSERWRYIRYADGSEELYDHHTDPYEWHNIAHASESNNVMRQHRNWLPRINAPLPAGSAGSDSPLYAS